MSKMVVCNRNENDGYLIANAQLETPVLTVQVATYALSREQQKRVRRTLARQHRLDRVDDRAEEYREYYARIDAGW